MLRKTPTCVLNMPMNEGQGNPHDSSGYGNNGTNSNAIWTAGDYGWAMEFNGSSTTINCGSGASLNIIDDITISAWVKTADINVAIFQKYNALSPYNGYALFLDATGKLRFFTNNLGGWQISNSGVADGTWHYIAVTGIGSVGTFYIDGSPDGTFAYTAPSDNVAEVLHIGASEGNSLWYDGLLSDIRIHNSPLSAAEILAHFNATKARYGL